jgi:hypothetical protein
MKFVGECVAGGEHAGPSQGGGHQRKGSHQSPMHKKGKQSKRQQMGDLILETQTQMRQRQALS